MNLLIFVKVKKCYLHWISIFRLFINNLIWSWIFIKIYKYEKYKKRKINIYSREIMVIFIIMIKNSNVKKFYLCLQANIPLGELNSLLKCDYLVKVMTKISKLLFYLICFILKSIKEMKIYKFLGLELVCWNNCNIKKLTKYTI